VFAVTPWPQLLVDTSIRCLRPITRLRTQTRNADRPFNWATMPGLIDARNLTYTGRPGTMLQGLCDSVGLKADAIDFSGPPVGRSPVGGRYIVVRPPTVRQEWMAASRNPAPGLVGQAADAMRKRGFKIVSVADVSPPAEVLVDPAIEADEYFHKGELNVEQLLALVAGAAGCVGGVGWLLPACIAYQTSLLLIYGGCLGHNGPQRILDPRLDTSRIHGAMPDAPCHCTRSDHSCSRSIRNFDAHVDAFADRLLATDRNP